MLKIENLHANIGGKEILKGIDLTVKDGEVHAIMGLNGAGKTRRVIKNGQVLIVKPDGTVYNMAGARMY